MKKEQQTTELQTSAIPAEAQLLAAPDAVTQQPAPLEEPTTGGSYLRDPVTGVLTPNTSKE